MMLLVFLIYGLGITIVAQITLTWPPKKFRPYMGYRTQRAMQNPEMWQAAQLHSSRIQRIGGLIFLAISGIGLLEPKKAMDNLSGGWVVATMFLFIAVFEGYVWYSTENHLKTRFDKNGKPKILN